MYQQIITYLSSFSFFNSVAFGILSLVIVGASWCIVGAIAGKAPKLNIQMEHLLLSGGIISMIISAIFMYLSGSAFTPDTPKAALLLTLLAFFIDGVMCYVQHVGTSKAMQHGPNGVIWALTQSAMVFPFMVGIIFYGVQLTVLRLAGIILLLTSLALFGGVKSDSGAAKGPWKLPTLIVLIVVIIGQVSVNIPFYYKETKGISNCFCILVMMIGYIIPAFIKLLLDKKGGFVQDMKKTFSRKEVWLCSVLLLPVAAVIAFTLQIPGMKVMGAHGLGGMCFPLMVGSCIASFSLYSVIVLKEKLKAMELTALILCITGLVCLCIVQ